VTRPLPGQLALAVPNVPPDDLSDLDVEAAEEAVAAETEDALRPRPCRCRRRSMYLLDADGRLRCAKCGRDW
jgi:hypothetical protein